MVSMCLLFSSDAGVSIITIPSPPPIRADAGGFTCIIKMIRLTHLRMEESSMGIKNVLPGFVFTLLLMSSV
jgi:hypothetical protein